VITKVQKWGNSLGVRIPKAIAQGAQVEAGMAVDVTIQDGRLVIIPRQGAVYDLTTLISRITPQNRHSEFGTGKPIGREVW
jgi:antitoxin MazE